LGQVSLPYEHKNTDFVICVQVLLLCTGNTSYNYPLATKLWGDIDFFPFVRPSVHPSVCSPKKFNFFGTFSLEDAWIDAEGSLQHFPCKIRSFWL